MAQQQMYAAEVQARIWEREILTSLFKKSIKSSNLNDFNNIKQVGGQIRLREIKSACIVNWSCDNRLFHKTMQEIAKKSKN